MNSLLVGIDGKPNIAKYAMGRSGLYGLEKLCE
jgi:hypothetical protein